MDAFPKLLSFLCRLEEVRLTYQLDHIRDKYIMVTVFIPGERWEIEFCEDGTVEVEKYISTEGVCRGEELLDELFSEDDKD